MRFCRVAERLVAWSSLELFLNVGVGGAPDGGPQAAGSARMTHQTRESQLLPVSPIQTKKSRSVVWGAPRPLAGTY